MCTLSSADRRFAALGTPQRIWAVSAIHGEAERLAALHDALLQKIRPGDRIVYHGNYLGYGTQAAATIDEILTFRRMALSIPGVLPKDFAYLRGGQEEIWEKLQQLQFAPNPGYTMRWMLDHGLAGTLQSYGFDVADGLAAAHHGVMCLTKWTRRLRDVIRRRPGHDIFMTQLRRAAFADDGNGAPLLFVNAGIDPARSLTDQGDSFWWCKKNFNTIELPYDPFSKVVRGFDPKHGGVRLNCVTATIDGGCGFGGALVCAGFEQDGTVSEMIEA